MVAIADFLAARGIALESVADTVEWAEVITPETGKGGLAIKLPGASYGDTPYTDGEFVMAVLEEGSGDATESSGSGSVLFRLDHNGGIGTNGGVHVALGLRKHASPAAGSVASVWADPSIDQIGFMAHNPTTAEVASTPVSQFFIAVDVRSDPSRNLWQIEADGTQTMRRQSGKADTGTVFRVRNDADSADVFKIRADGGFHSAAYSAIGATAPASTVALLLQGTADNQVPLYVVKNASSMTANLLSLVAENGATLLSRFNKDAYFMTRKTSAPADGDIATSEMALWFDHSAGAAKLMIKAKDSGGTVRTGSVSLS